MEDADSDSGFDSDGDWYHAGRDIVYGLRTNSHAVGPDGAHRRRFLCEEEKKGGTPVKVGCLSLFLFFAIDGSCQPFISAMNLRIIHMRLSVVWSCSKSSRRVELIQRMELG